MADDLSAPLLPKSQRNAARRDGMLKGLRSNFPLARIAFAIIVLAVGGVVLRVALIDEPDGGRPSADVPINSTRNNNQVAGEIAPAPPVPSGPVTITADPEQYPVGQSAPSIITIDDPPGAADGAGDGTVLLAGFTEDTENGPIPRISEAGVTPFEAYARPADGAAGTPRIAIIVSGLGLNEGVTLDAIAGLPNAVTLAFAPYGRTLERTVSAARADGHELLLEVPLEPFDYPDNDPGPQTLLTGQPPRANMQKLYWLMARMGGYVGLINNMGARFTASAPDFGPLMEELGTRGLGYIDDGSSNRSLAPQLSAAHGVPYTRADILVDINPARAPIMAALAELEAKASAGGTAVGIATALPVTIAAIAEWAEGLGDRGIVLAPVSALMAAPAR